MTPDDAIKKLIADELEKRGIQDANAERISSDRADHERFAREQSAPRVYPPSAVDSRDAPVHYEETVLPMREIPFTQPDSTPAAAVPPLPVDLDGGEWTTVMYCDSDGGDVLRQVLSRPVP